MIYGRDAFLHSKSHLCGVALNYLSCLSLFCRGLADPHKNGLPLVGKATEDAALNGTVAEIPADAEPDIAVINPAPAGRINPCPNPIQGDLAPGVAGTFSFRQPVYIAGVQAGKPGQR